MMSPAIRRIEDKIISLRTQYNAEHDVNVDFNWVDMHILEILEDILIVVYGLDKELDEDKQ